MRRPINLVESDRIRPCSVCKQNTIFTTERGRPLHPACGYGFELFHPEAETGIDAGIETCLDSLGAIVVAVRNG